MSIEQKINYQLNKYPAVKKVIKRAYQTGMYAISKINKIRGDITRISLMTKSYEYFLDIMISLLGIFQIDICCV